MSVEEKENNKENFLWLTPPPSGTLLLGDKTEEEIKKENEEYNKNKLNEESEQNPS